MAIEKEDCRRQKMTQENWQGGQKRKELGRRVGGSQMALRRKGVCISRHKVRFVCTLGRGNFKEKT